MHLPAVANLFATTIEMLVKSTRFYPYFVASVTFTFPAKNLVDFTSISIVAANRLATAGKCMIFISCFLTFYCDGQSLLPFLNS